MWKHLNYVVTLAGLPLALNLACSRPNAPVEPNLDDMAVTSDSAQMVAPDMSQASYPSGPYGAEVGKVIDNLKFQGYFSPSKTSGLAKTGTAYGEVSLDALRTVPSAKYLMIHLAAYW